MLGGKATTLAKIRSLVHIRLPVWTLSISPFSLLSVNAGCFVTSALAGLIVTIRVVGVFFVQGEYSDPFTRYEAILPGNPASALTSYNCPISHVYEQLDLGHFSCTIFPRDGSFEIIRVDGWNGTITKLTFYATNLMLGQILLHWKPAAYPEVNVALVWWNTPRYSVDAYSENFGSYLQYQKLVRIVSVGYKPEELPLEANQANTSHHP